MKMITLAPLPVLQGCRKSAMAAPATAGIDIFNNIKPSCEAKYGASGPGSYNPFIWCDRTREVHLQGHHPTDLANTAVFGTYDDNTNVSANRYYVTTTGLPYAIDIPGTFRYPTESTDITQAYLHFAAWAQSGGTSFVDWYSNTAIGYRNNSDIYIN